MTGAVRSRDCEAVSAGIAVPRGFRSPARSRHSRPSVTGLPGTQQDLLKVLRIDGEGHGEVHPGEGRDVIGG